jgi:Fanconi-associated nuclease 1
MNCADICLTRGAKRKLTQSSLLDFRFSKKPTVDPTLASLNNDDEETNKGVTDGGISSDTAFLSRNSSDPGSPEDSATPSLTACLHGSPDISKMHDTCIPSNVVSPNTENAENDGAVEKDSPHMLSAGTASASIDACPDTDSSTKVVVATVIVGRRFRENIELQEGVGITVLRDPQNAKDPDAIKVCIIYKEAVLSVYFPSM